MGRVEKSLWYLSWHYAIDCVLAVFKENQAAETRSGSLKASSDCWAINDSLRQQVHERARRYWCQSTELDHTYFPLSVDAVARLYFRIRKRTLAEIKDFEAEIEAAFGAERQKPLFPDENNGV